MMQALIRNCEYSMNRRLRLAHPFSGLVLGMALVAMAPAAAAPADGATQEPLPQQAPAAPGPAPSPRPAASPGKSSSLGDIGYMNAAQLADRCQQSDAASSSYCFAYLAAVTDTARAYEIWLGSREFCLPAGIAQAEVRRAFLGYVSVYPAQTAGQAASVVVNSLKQTYPCD